MSGAGAIDKPEGATRFRLRMRVNGARQTVGWYDSTEDAERAREAHLLVLTETAADYEGLTLLKLGHKVLTRREVKKSVRDPDNDWSRFNEHIAKDLIGKMAVRAVQSRHVYGWLDRLEDKGLAPQTRRNCLSLLRTIFRAAHKAGTAKVNPCADVRVEGKDKDAWTYLTPEELPRMLGAFDEEDRHLAAVAIGTGVRPGELVTLRRADVFLEDRPRIIVRYGKPPDLPTKTQAVRTVHLFGLALVAMRAWMGRPAPKKNPHGLVFPRVRGGFRDEDHIIRWEEWTAVKERAGITRRFRWYDFRHTCASWLVSGWWGPRWSLQEVKEMLGHTSITITQRYAHLAQSASEEVARRTGWEVENARVSVGQQLCSVSSEDAHGSCENLRGKLLAPPTRVELVAFGLGIPRFHSNSAEIATSDPPLTRGSKDAPGPGLAKASSTSVPVLEALDASLALGAS